MRTGAFRLSVQLEGLEATVHFVEFTVVIDGSNSVRVTEHASLDVLHYGVVSPRSLKELVHDFLDVCQMVANDHRFNPKLAFHVLFCDGVAVYETSASSACSKIGAHIYRSACNGCSLPMRFRAAESR